MRKFSTVSAFFAGIFVALAGVYLSQPISAGGPVAVQAGFSPSALAISADMKGESWDAF